MMMTPERLELIDFSYPFWIGIIKAMTFANSRPYLIKHNWSHKVHSGCWYLGQAKKVDFLPSFVLFNRWYVYHYHHVVAVREA